MFDFIVGSNLSLTAKRFLEHVVASCVKVVKFDVFGVLLVSPINIYDLPQFKFMNSCTLGEACYMRVHFSNFKQLEVERALVQSIYTLNYDILQVISELKRRGVETLLVSNGRSPDFARKVLNGVNVSQYIEAEVGGSGADACALWADSHSYSNKY